MNWSISAHKIFQQCRRKWYYKVKAADARVKRESERIEITRLANLITVDSWRGQIVDQIISEVFVKKLWRKEVTQFQDLSNVAWKVFEKQFELATSRNADESFGELGWGFVEVEYGNGITSQMRDKAWNDIELSFKNLLNDQSLIEDLLRAELLLPQWSFQYKKGNINVKCIPDLVAFYKNDRPIVIDWKVNSFGTNSNENQLILYAIALVNAKAQERYADFLVGINPTDVKLIEYQLLMGDNGVKRIFEIDIEDVLRIDHLISKSALEIYGMNGFEKYQNLNPSNFDTTDYPENCKNCQFKKLCKTVN